MGVDLASYRIHPTTVSLGNFNGSTFASVASVAHPLHRMYTALNCRVTLNPRLNTGTGVEGVTSLDPQPDVNGDTIFLPFMPNEIRSMILPAAPVATAAGIDSFLTTNLSGCKFFVDGVPADGRKVVYHANNMANSPPGQVSAELPTFELTVCTNFLNRLYNDAHADYLAAPHNLVLVAEVNAAKPAYNQGAQAEIMRKKGQGRKNVQFVGGTIVFGRVNGANWEFYYATYGDMEYDRPLTSPMILAGKHRSVTTNDHPNYRVLDFAQIM